MQEKNNFPKHVAFIMDGNRRWARQHGFALFMGHGKGEDRIEPIIDESIELGISYLTFWGFSTENWNRKKAEVEFLLNLYRNVLDRKMNSFHAKKIKVNVIGNLSLFPKDIREKSKEWMEQTKNNKAITVNFALSYGGRDEILRVVEKMRANAKFQMPNVKLSKEEFEKYLDTVGQPDPDLIIRTGGEHRLSGFLLWQSEYSELYFSDCLWPDFTVSEFRKAFADYSQRKRRFGR